MNELIRSLYHVMEDQYGGEFLRRSEYRSINQEFNAYMDRVEEATSYEFHEDLYNVIMDFLILEENKAFLWGLRLGLQLHTL